MEPHLIGYSQKYVPQAYNKNGAGCVKYLPQECSSHVYPNNVQGFVGCWIHLARTRAPMAVLGMPTWNTTSDFLIRMYSYWADFLVIGDFERDAGCYELATQGDATALASCPIPSATPSEYYWTTDAFDNYLAKVKALAEYPGIEKPVLWWQLPLGVESLAPGSPKRYRDNRVAYVFARTQEMAHVSTFGGLGAVFGSGEPNQTNISTDDGQFLNALSQYKSAPTPLP